MAALATLWLVTAPILGGERTIVGEFPTTVAIVVGDALCTGTLVTPEWVVTAAHCLQPASVGLPSQDAVTENTTVHFDTVDLTRSLGAYVRAAVTIPHPDYVDIGAADIGLVRLAVPITDYAPARINLDAANAPVGVTVTLVGFGKTSTLPTAMGGVQFALPGRTSTSCGAFGLSNTQLLCFSQADDKGTCSGDSGGPAFTTIADRATLVGVTSFGDTDCNELGASTRTDIERAFLLEHIPGLEGCPNGDECSAGQICYLGRCIVTPLEGSGLGNVCGANSHCDSNVCAIGPEGTSTCTELCDAGDRMSCPAGLECLELEAGQGGACWPIPDSGCCDAGGRGAPTMLFGAGLVAFLLGGRIRGRSSRGPRSRGSRAARGSARSSTSPSYR